MAVLTNQQNLIVFVESDHRDCAKMQQDVPLDLLITYLDTIPSN
jgi:hypothetical protein